MQEYKIVKNIFYSNVASTGGGGGIYWATLSEPIIKLSNTFGVGSTANVAAYGRNRASNVKEIWLTGSIEEISTTNFRPFREDKCRK